jgi:hypothetical protein
LPERFRGPVAPSAADCAKTQPALSCVRYKDTAIVAQGTGFAKLFSDKTKKGLLFVTKKKQKTLLILVPGMARARHQINKSFLVLFLKRTASLKGNQAYVRDDFTRRQACNDFGQWSGPDCRGYS